MCFLSYLPRPTSRASFELRSLHSSAASSALDNSGTIASASASSASATPGGRDVFDMAQPLRYIGAVECGQFIASTCKNHQVFFTRKEFKTQVVQQPKQFMKIV
jgi:hypothetical protein